MSAVVVNPCDELEERQAAGVAAASYSLPPLDEEVRWILGRPNFMCAGIAGALRMSGQEIKRKAEEEQAAVLHWMLTLYVQHGAGWREVAERLLAEARV